MTRFNRCRRKYRIAFSLLELLAVVVILGILAVTVIPVIGIHAYEAKEKTCHTYKADLNKAIERYHALTGDWPSDLDTLEHPDYYPEAIPKCPAENSDYAIDPATNRIIGHNH
jgi:prepilin-type N-terminal cleavage/methylation domain-containing protein